MLNSSPSSSSSRGEPLRLRVTPSDPHFARKLIRSLFCGAKHLWVAENGEVEKIAVPLVRGVKAGESHSNLVNVKAVIETPNAFYFLAPYSPMTLANFITFNRSVFLSSPNIRLFLIYQIIRGLEHLHDVGLYHGRCAILFLPDHSLSHHTYTERERDTHCLLLTFSSF